MNSDLFKLMEENNITLRALPKFERYCFSYNKGDKLHPKCTEIFRVKIRNISEECFKKSDIYNYRCFEFDNGVLYRYYQKGIETRDGGWLAKIDSSHNSVQKWSRKDDFYGATPEEAILKAVESLKK